MSYTLITGASGGIGAELAKIFAANKHNLILVARRQDLLLVLKSELEAKYDIQAQVIAKDLAQPLAARELHLEVMQNQWEVDTLVNNAGYGVYGYFSETELSQEMDMLRLNMLTLTELTKLFMIPMLKKASGKILNVASTAAFQPGPVMACYYASKAYVLSFSEAISKELKGAGVSVSVLCPGPTESDFQSRAKIHMGIPLFKAAGIMSAAAVAEAGYKGLQRGKRVIIPGLLNKITPLGMRFFPRSWVTAIAHYLQDSQAVKKK